DFIPMGVESYLVPGVFTDECCHPNRFRVELMLIESFEIGRLDFPNRDTLKSTHCFLPNETQDQRPRARKNVTRSDWVEGERSLARGSLHRLVRCLCDRQQIRPTPMPRGWDDQV